MSKVVGVRPSSTAELETCVLAGWALAPPGTVDPARNVAWVGSLRRVPESVGLCNADDLAGTYALIAAKPKGLLVARGRHAGRCLYIARLSNGCVAACSRFAPLVGCLTSITPDVRTLASLLLTEPPADLSATVIKEVRRVESSQVIVLDGEKVENSVRSALDLTPRQGTPDELAEEVRTLLERAVRRSMEGARRVAIAVSGGLDSSGVLAHAVAVARGASQPEVDAVTWSFAGPGDDRPYLRDLCDALGIIPLRISSTEASKNVVPSMIADEMPFIWPSTAGIFTAHVRARDRGADVVLTGQGGDQVFNGDTRVFAKHAVGGDWYGAISRITRFPGYSGSGSFLRIAKRVLGPPVVSAFPYIRRVKRRRIASRRWPWAGPKLREVLRDTYVSEAPDREWMSFTSELKFRRLIFRDFLHIAETRGQMEAASGLTQIDPLLDDELVSLVASVPQQLLLFGDRSRGLYRHSLREMVPESVRLRRGKALFECAIAAMVGGTDLRLLRDLASMRMLGQLGLVDPQGYRPHFEAVLAAGGATFDWMAVWPALAVEAFVRRQWGRLREEVSWPTSA
jgi:asparagine synthase (glutamine-hydrolysing)